MTGALITGRRPRVHRTVPALTTTTRLEVREADRQQLLEAARQVVAALEADPAPLLGVVAGAFAHLGTLLRAQSEPRR
jgi:hypothetical protein